MNSPLLPHGRKNRIELELGPVHYESQGSGTPVVFVHGAFVDASLWTELARTLAQDHQCFLPTWPLGAHTEPMHPQAEVTPLTVARMVAEFLDKLGLEDVTLVGNDSGGAICQLVAVHHPERVSRIVLSNCDAFEVFPPKAFNYFKVVPRVPGMLTVLSKELYMFPSLAQLPTAFGSLSRRPLDTELLKRWLRPAAKDPQVRRDLGKLLRSIDSKITIEAGARLGEFDGEVLLLWGEADRHFTVQLAERLERSFRNAQLIRFAGSKTFLSLDEPQRMAHEIRRFTAAQSASVSDAVAGATTRSDQGSSLELALA